MLVGLILLALVGVASAQQAPPKPEPNPSRAAFGFTLKDYAQCRVQFGEVWFNAERLAAKVKALEAEVAKLKKEDPEEAKKGE